jgi:hypothetical protein
MTHAWCRDIARDAAVRAAEDGRTSPLPTLEEAIVLAFGFDKASAQRACDEVKSWPEDVQKDCRFVLGNLLEQGVERLQALVEAWRFGKGLLAARYPEMIPKSVSASSAVEQENKGDGMATSGLRTERVTMEERITLEFSFDHRSNFRPKEWAATFLPGAVCQGISVRVVDGDITDNEIALTVERDAAIRERDESRASLNRCPECNGEGQHDSGGTDASGEWINLPCDGCGSTGTIHGYVEATDKLRARVTELQAASGGGESIGRKLAERLGRFADRLESGELDMPSGLPTAASGGGEGEGTFFGAGGPFNFQYAEDSFFPPNVHGFLRQCVKIKDAPPQPRGWLTEEEREAVEFLASLDVPPCVDAARKAARSGKALLARSSPPEVVLPEADIVWNEEGRRVRKLDPIKVREALTSEGVLFKEAT